MPSSPAPAAIVANLAAEADFARTLGLRRSAAPLTPAAQAAAARFGLLLNALAADGDVLLLPAAPADADRAALADLPGLPALTADRCAVWPRPGDDGGTPDAARVPAGGRVLAWAETEAVAALRVALATTERATGAALGPGGPTGEALGTGGAMARAAAPRTGHAIADALWALAPPTPMAAARANDRRVALAAAAGLPGTPPGAAAFVAADDLAAHIEGVGAAVVAATGSRRWVVKAACSAAGRDRLWLDAAALDTAAAARAARFLRRHGAAVAEPWLDRTADAGAVGVVDAAGGVQTVGLHRQRVDDRGRFRGVDVPLAMPAPGDDGGIEAALALRPGEAAALRAAHAGAGERLAALGYRGPFGVDAWRWRGADGVERWHALGEINARLSVGLVARVLVDRVVAAAGPGRAAAIVARTAVVRVADAAGSVGGVATLRQPPID